MLHFLGQETFWLIVTNIAFGSVTLVCIIAAVGATIYGLRGRAHKGIRAHDRSDDHELVLSDFGITVADRGKRLDEQKLLRTRSNIAGNRRHFNLPGTED